MVTGDFDQDGDIDLAGASAMGSMTVVENDGQLFDVPLSQPFTRTETRASDKSGIKSMVLLDADGDADPDVAINSSSGVFVFTGGAGLSFTAKSSALPGTASATDLVRADLDGDGLADLATACRLLSCVAVLKGMPDLSYQLALVAPVPSADMIAAGDIDGDGSADLAGAGEVIWTVLSSRAPQPATGTAPPSRPPVDGVVLNEVMTSNLTIPLDSNGRTPDFVELYNGKTTGVDLTGWQLRYQERAQPMMPPPALATHHFVGNTTLAPGGRTLLICDERNLPDHALFKLSRTGGTLTLVNPDGAEMDTVSWENQIEDVSLGRFSDGAGTWITKSPPDPGQPNYLESTSGPVFKQVSLEPATVLADSAPRFFVKATDDAGIFTLTVVWKWLNPPANVPAGDTTGQLGLFDDGLHGDGASLDGLFSAILPMTLPTGAKIEFFVKATNLLDEEEVAPGDPIFSLPGEDMTNYSIIVPGSTTAVPGLEVSEVQTHSAILDERGEASDFIELRNTGTAPADLTGLALRDGLYSTERTFDLSGSLAPGEHRFFYADSDPNQGPRHLPFKLSNEGDSVWLVRLDYQGAPAILDKISPPAREGSADSWARLGPGGPFMFLSPTAGRVNLLPGTLHGELLPPAAPGALRTFRLALSASAGTQRVIESWIPSTGAAWQAAGQVTGNGFESWLDFPVSQSSKSRFFRAR